MSAEIRYWWHVAATDLGSASDLMKQIFNQWKTIPRSDLMHILKTYIRFTCMWGGALGRQFTAKLRHCPFRFQDTIKIYLCISYIHWMATRLMLTIAEEWTLFNYLSFVGFQLLSVFLEEIKLQKMDLEKRG